MNPTLPAAHHAASDALHHQVAGSSLQRYLDRALPNRLSDRDHSIRVTMLQTADPRPSCAPTKITGLGAVSNTVAVRQRRTLATARDATFATTKLSKINRADRPKPTGPSCQFDRGEAPQQMSISPVKLNLALGAVARSNWRKLEV